MPYAIKCLCVLTDLFVVNVNNIYGIGFFDFVSVKLQEIGKSLDNFRYLRMYSRHTFVLSLTFIDFVKYHKK